MLTFASNSDRSHYVMLPGKSDYCPPLLTHGWLEIRLPAKFQPPERIASGVWILSRLGWVVKSNNSANSARLSYASQLELSLAKWLLWGSLL